MIVTDIDNNTADAIGIGIWKYINLTNLSLSINKDIFVD